MKMLLRRYALLVVLMMSSVSPALTQTSPPIIQKIVIQHVGPHAASDAMVRANIRVKEGDPYTRSTIDQDVRTLYGTGYFYNIRVGEERSPQGVILTYVVQGKPIVTEIQFTGNKRYSRTRLLKKISTKIGEPLDERKLFADTQAILKLYQNAGRPKTTVKYTPNIVEEAGRGSVVFEIDESPRVKIEQVDFVGAQAFSQRKLRKVIKTRERWMFSWLTGSGILKDEQFEDDKERLADFYRNEGYIDFEIKDIQFENVDPKWMVIRFIVSEGRQYKVGAVEIKGNELFTDEQIFQGITVGGKPVKLTMTAGETFTPKGLTEDIEAIRDFYGSKGYIDARIFAQRTPNVERGTMDITYEIEEKDISYIEKVEIRGNTKTKDRVIRRELAVSPGEVFDMTKVDLSKTRLEQMNFFEKVDTQPEPTQVPNRRDLVVSVEEKNTGNLMVGAGFSTIDQVVGFIELNQGNFDLFNPPFFTGGGQKFRLRATIGTKRQDYVMTFIEPWFLGQKLALQTDLYYRELTYLSDYYDEQRVGGRVGLTKALGSDFLIGGISYTLEDVGVLDVEEGAPQAFKDEEGHSLISKIGASLAYDTSNSAMLPSRGQRTELIGEVAGGPFGGEKDFYKIELRSSWFFRGFAEGHIFEVTGRAGVAEAYGNTDQVPFFDRYYLGGMWSLRGYKFRHAGADETFQNGEPVGGNTYWMGSAEYSVPIIERLRFALFYDIGNVYSDSYDFDFGNYLHNWGVGLRLNLPIGPLRFDYGIPINSGKDTGSSGKFHFGVGWNRNF